MGVVTPRGEAARALWEVRPFYQGVRGAWEARDHVARVCARAVVRGDWEAAAAYAAAYELLTVVYRRADRVAAARLVERTAALLARPGWAS